MPTVAEKPVKSLEHWYNATLKDIGQGDQIKQDTISSLESTENSLLPGRLKLW